MTVANDTASLWGGRFAGKLHPVFDELNRSLPFDQRMLNEDINGSIAWAEGLVSAKVLKPEEAAQIRDALEEIRAEVTADLAVLDESEAEDIHTFVEEQLTAKVGDLGKRLHTGRSRNDQVATDLKLWMHTALGRIYVRIRQLQQALVALAGQHAGTALPGYTHLQRAQPVTFGHQCLAYVEMLERDATRVMDTLVRMDTCPLGSGALAGTAYPVDREQIATNLGFRRGATRNSLDAVCDRDHVLETLFLCTTTMLHLSRLAEDWIFLATQEAGILTFGDLVSTGSSLMPQKRNPDALELLRGKVGRVHGALTTLITTTKGLPLAYDKDLQEDKEALFGAIETTEDCLQVAAIVAGDVEVNIEAAFAATRGGHLDATDLADLLVAEGVPFREAHDRIGAAVNCAVVRGVELQDLTAEERAEHLPELVGVDLAVELSTDAMLARRDVIGGTAIARVEAEIDAWEERLKDTPS